MKSSIYYASKLCYIFKIFSNYFLIFLIHCAASKRKTKVTSIRFLWSIIAMTSGEASAKLSFTLTSKNCSWEKCPKQLLNFWIMKMLYGGVSIVRPYSIFFRSRHSLVTYRKSSEEINHKNVANIRFE